MRDPCVSPAPESEYKLVRPGFWLTAILAAAVLCVSGMATAQTVSVQEQSAQGPRHHKPPKPRPTPEAGSLLLLGTGLLGAGGALLLTRMKKKATA